jgi:hypothetical protein
LNGNRKKNQVNIFYLYLFKYSLRIELQDAEAEDLASGKDITKDTRRRQR